MGVHTFEADEARRLMDTIISNFERPSGLGDLTFKIEIETGPPVVGQVVERDGESSREGVLIATTEEDQVDHLLVRWDEIVWLGVGWSY